MGGGGVSSAKHRPVPRHSDLRSSGGPRAWLRGGVVPLHPRPHAAVHTWSFDRSNVGAAQGRRGSRRGHGCTRVARKRARLRSRVSPPCAVAQTRGYFTWVVVTESLLLECQRANHWTRSAQSPASHRSLSSLSLALVSLVAD